MNTEQIIESQHLAESKGYWQETAKGFAAATSLGVDREELGQPVESARYAQQELTLSAETTDMLREFTDRHEISFETLADGAWAVLLSRHSREAKVLFGTVQGAVSAEESVKALPLGVEVEAEARLIDWLRQLGKRLDVRRRYADVSLAQVQMWSAMTPEDSPFESVLAFDEAAENVLCRSRKDDETSSQSNSPNYPLMVVALMRKTLALKALYDRRRFDEGTIVRVLNHLRVLLEEASVSFERRVSEWPLMAQDERHRLLVEWNDTRREYPQRRPIHQLFEEQVERTPEAVALRFEGESLTYRELNSRANRLAHHLRSVGVRAETLVGICAERSFEMVVGLFGILKAGGAYVPLAPGDPPERLAFMLQDTDARMLLTQHRLLGALPKHSARVICLDSEWETIAQGSAENPSVNLSDENIAYVIYTSGSTGRPKGVINTHGPIRNRLLWMQRAYTLSAADSVMQKTPFSFDVSVWEFFWPLMTGARLVLAKPEGHRDAQYLCELIEREQITTLHFVPAMLQLFLLEAQTQRCDSLKRVICSGEALSYELQERFHARFSAELSNLYGPTEAAVDVTSWDCERDSQRRVVPIGRPIDNIQMRILDEELQPVPVGISGELRIGGVGLARGYLRRPDATAEKFIPDPFSHVAGARLYSTGDLARYLDDGEIEYQGRIDFQIKVHGHRIEAGELEAVLRKQACVREAAVIAWTDAAGSKRLVAYVVRSQGAQVTTADLRQYLAAKLPEYMIPTIFVFLAQMPLTQSGKVNRKALPAPDLSNSETETDFVAARTPVEAALAAIWSEVLGVARVGVRDDFFALGGHSLLAAMVISRVRQALGVELPQRIFFEAPTLDQLAERIEESKRINENSTEGTTTMTEASKSLNDLSTEKRAALVMRLKKTTEAVGEQAIPRRKDTGHVPLSFAQQRLWFLDQLDQSNAYIVPATSHLTGRLDAGALERSLNEIVRRHETLRTTFTSLDGQPMQVIAPQLTLNVPVLDLSRLPFDEREQEVRRLRQEALRPFDLEHGPLVRASLVRLAEEEHLLLLAMHHIISDGWSLGVLIREMATFYEAFVTNQRPSLAGLPIQYADFAVWQRQWLTGEVLEQQLAYWKRQLGDSPAALELPTSRPRPPVQTYQGSFLTLDLGKELTEAIKDLSRREGVTLYMTLLACFKILLARYAGQEQIVVGTPIANRNWIDIENLIGFFVNTLVLSTDLAGNPTFHELLDRVREVTLGAFAHQDVPFEKLVEELQPERDMSRSPLFQVMFSLQNAPMPPLELAGVTMSLLQDESTMSQFDLTLDVTERADGLVCLLEYNTDIFERATAERILAHFRNLLEGSVANPQQRIKELPLLTNTERAQLLHDWNDTAHDYPSQRCIHQLFEEQVERAPEATALVFADEQMSYRELNTRANQLAHLLLSLGISPERRVAILLQRSTLIPLALLAVLKAGAAFLALDPSAPTHRLRSLLADAQVDLILSQRSLIDLLPPDAPRLSLDSQPATLASHRSDNPLCRTLSANLAYLVYTSGTTGTPKAILVEHRSLVNAIHAFIREHRMSATDRLLQFASLSFDVATEEFFSAWLAGACAVMWPQPVVGSHAEFARFLEHQQVTVVNLAASFWAAWLEALCDGGAHLPSALRKVIVGNEKTLEQTLAKWRAVVGDRLQWGNAYGPSETTITASNYRPSESGAWRAGSSTVPIGRPIINAQMYVLDAEQQVVPVGVVGELYIGGAGVARGYHKEGGLTAERFVPHPYSRRGGERLYRTGDMGRWLVEGELEFVGREDEQLKIRGYRIEIGEIEAVLAQQESVRACCVVAGEDGRGGQRLVGYVVAQGEVRTGELRSYLEERLPEYMIPGVIVKMEGMPLTPNGKVDRRALPRVDEAVSESDEQYVAPRNVAERVIADIWREVLKVEKIGVHDNFFSRGGHSLLLVSAHSKVREALKVNISMIEMFKYPTVSALAEHLSTESAVAPAAAPTRNLAEGRIEALNRQRQLRQRAIKR